MWKFILEQRITSQQQDLNQANAQRETTNQQLQRAKDQVYELELKYIYTKVEREEKQQTLSNLESQHKELNKQYQEILTKLKTAQRNREEKERLLGVNPQSLKAQIDSLTQKIRVLDVIINAPEPKPQYKLDGEYCINNIYHCTNHPPRQVLTNGEQIAQHRKAVADARMQKTQLLAELEQLQQQYNKIIQNYSNLQLQIKIITQTCEQLEKNLQSLQQQIAENDELLTQTKQTCETLVKVETQISNQLSNARSNVYDLTGKLAELDFDIRRLEKNLYDDKLELERLNNAEKERISQQISTQPITSSEISSEETIEESMLDKLRQLALKELEELKAAPSSLKQQIKQASALVADDMVDKIKAAAAGKIGTIPSQVMQNLNSIGNFNNRKVSETQNSMSRDLDKFQSEDDSNLSSYKK